MFLECSVTSNPSVDEISWTFNDEPLVDARRDGILIANHSLVLQKVRRRHRGFYHCVARNSVGSSKSGPFFLRVQCE